MEDVSIGIYSGEILAIVGDNGAGKSTLVKVLSGAVIPDAGEILLQEKSIRFDSPQMARQHGVETVYQDLALAPNRDVVQNLYLGRELCFGGFLGPFHFLRSREMQRLAEQHLKELEVGVPSVSGLPIGQMSGGQRQAVAVARTAFWSSKVMFMDEPTAALGVRESEAVLRLIRRVASAGTAVALISHAIPHVVAIADRIVVLRHGRLTAELRGSTTVENVVNLIVGSDGGVTKYGSRDPVQDQGSQ
ncbi:MAG: ATP-binding cassette domain-containing protein [Chloroflexi bacterium]|nr:ATP-binding cassette domain-containing protein [Chloroflexota bacterium]